MTTTEHLQKIKAKCEQLLAIASSRSPDAWGELRMHGSAGLYMVTGESVGCVADACYQQDAAFIASCAGPAEAGWKATIEAVDWILNTQKEHFDAWLDVAKETGVTPGPIEDYPLATLAKPLIATWPIELL